MFGVVWDYYSAKLKGKQYKQITQPKSYKTEIKILTNPYLASSGFEQPSPEYRGGGGGGTLSTGLPELMESKVI